MCYNCACLCQQARDDAFAAEVDIDEKEDEEKDTDTLQTSSVNFQLVPSELKPYTRCVTSQIHQ